MGAREQLKEIEENIGEYDVVVENEEQIDLFLRTIEGGEIGRYYRGEISGSEAMAVQLAIESERERLYRCISDRIISVEKFIEIYEKTYGEETEKAREATERRMKKFKVEGAEESVLMRESYNRMFRPSYERVEYGDILTKYRTAENMVKEYYKLSYEYIQGEDRYLTEEINKIKTFGRDVIEAIEGMSVEIDTEKITLTEDFKNEVNGIIVDDHIERLAILTEGLDEGYIKELYTIAGKEYENEATARRMNLLSDGMVQSIAESIYPRGYRKHSLSEIKERMNEDEKRRSIDEKEQRGA